MGKGKKKENAYSIYVKEYRQRIGCGHAEAFELAKPGWDKLTQEQKQKYVDEANRFKTATIPLAVSKANKDEDDRKHAMKEDIMTTINLSHDRVFEHNFYLIHINYYFYVSSEEKYYPAEVSLVRFNLQEGIDIEEELTRRGEMVIKPMVYHSYCNPGKLPVGYAGDIQKTAHKLPYPGRDDAEELETSTEREIFDQIVSNLRQDLLQNQSLPPIYTPKKFKKEIGMIVDSWVKNFGYEEDYIKVYEFEELFYQLNLACARIRQEKYNRKLAMISNPVHAELLVSKDYFDFTPDIACEFHELSDVVNQCSRSFVTRWVYLVCSYCCEENDMIPIQHMPEYAQVLHTEDEA